MDAPPGFPQNVPIGCPLPCMSGSGVRCSPHSGFAPVPAQQWERQGTGRPRVRVAWLLRSAAWVRWSVRHTGRGQSPEG